ncbi:MAG TPA: hypothetical protein VNI84_01350 [Pyrinomonadaceae bacterium]|nr:hypothetical protein [Pyrinomonadaceae bacterium]
MWNDNAQINRLTQQIGYLNESLQRNEDDLAIVRRSVGNILDRQINTPPSPAANQLWNGELGHSVNSWFDAALTIDDKSKECAFWFSHDGMLSGLALESTDARTSAVNKTLKHAAHSNYSSAFSRWNSENGWAELTGTKTLDALLPANFIDATTRDVFVSMIAAKRNAFIEIPENALMFAGVYDNTLGQRKFLTGTLGFSAALNGTPAAQTIERRYKIHVKSDRGFSLISPEIVVAGAPADNLFSSSKNISMNWRQTAGQSEVDIYEFVPATATYRLIQTVSAASSYIHEGDFLRAVGGYPASTGTERRAVYYTRVGELSSLATNGVSPSWDTINFLISVPNDYSKAVTTDREWLRAGITTACNLFVTGCATDGTTTIKAPAAVFEAQYAALYGGLTTQIYDENDVLLLSTTVSSRTDDTHLVLVAAVPARANVKIRILGAGFHGVLVDKIHLGFQRNVSYAPNPFDARALQPVAAPTSSTQGTVGEGGTGGGITTCVAAKTPVKTASGQRIAIEKNQPGDSWDSAEFAPNILLKLKEGFDYVRRVRSANNCFIECTDTERFIVSRSDSEGTPLFRLRVGDAVLTEIDGRIESSRIIEISEYLGKTFVYTPTLSNNRLFIAGEIRRFGFFEKLTEKALSFFRRKVAGGGFLLHNSKRVDDYEVSQF